jgi:hypothetical protein
MWQQAGCTLVVQGKAKLARLHQRASGKRFVRIAGQVLQMQETAELPKMTSQWDA